MRGIRNIGTPYAGDTGRATVIGATKKKISFIQNIVRLHYTSSLSD
jgi:hypothetical protein